MVWVIASGGQTTAEAQRIVELGRAVRELRPANEILEAASAFFGRSGARPQSEVAEVPVVPSTYYAAKTCPRSARAARDETLTAAIMVAHNANLGVDGARKIHAELNREGPRWLASPLSG